MRQVQVEWLVVERFIIASARLRLNNPVVFFMPGVLKIKGEVLDKEFTSIHHLLCCAVLFVILDFRDFFRNKEKFYGS